MNVNFFKWAKPGLFLVYFCSFSQHKDKYSTNFTINDKSIDGVLGSRTRGGMMEGTDKSTELWRHPYYDNSYSLVTTTRVITDNSYNGLYLNTNGAHSLLKLVSL